MVSPGRRSRSGGPAGPVPRTWRWRLSRPHTAQVMLVSPTDGKPVSQLNVAAPGLTPSVAQAVPFGNLVLVGNEVGGQVLAVKEVAGKLADQLAWQHAGTGLIVKKIAVQGDRAAVAYWGGSLTILGPDGSVMATETWWQDIADLTWSGDRLLVAIADGRLFALTVK